MRYVFGYAGIPSGVAYDKIYSRRKSIVGASAEFVGIPLRDYEVHLSKRHANFFHGRFKDRILLDRQHDSSDTAFAVIYARSTRPNYMNTTEFEESVFPSTFLIPVDWKIEGCNRSERNQSVNQLFHLLCKATNQARNVLNEIHKEINEKRNRTPLLLPLRNSRSSSLKESLLELQFELAKTSNAGELIRQKMRLLIDEHSRQQNKKAHYFLDNVGVEFHPPGSHLHGLPHPTSDHPDRCFVGGYRRFGSPFNPAFHYDCIKGEGPLIGDFHSCHSNARVRMKGHPHLNIAPNDHVRGRA